MRSSSGPRRRISKVERKECIATIVTTKELEKHCEHWRTSSHKRSETMRLFSSPRWTRCLQVSRMALMVSVMLASFPLLA